MKEKCKEFLEGYLDRYSIPYEFEEIDGEFYASGQYCTFTEEPLKNVQLIQRFIIDNDGIISMAMFESEIEDTDKIEKLAKLFSEKYEIRIRYDSDYSAIKADAGMAEGALIENSRIMRSFVTFPLLVLRMVVYAYYVVKEDGLDPEEVFNDISEHEGDFIISDEITYSFDDSDSIIKEGRERYFIEHDFLPAEFYSDPEAFVKSVNDGKEEFLKGIINDALFENAAPQIPDYDTFRLETILESDECICIDMILPKADKYLECSDIIFFWTKNGEPVYYTVEIKYENDEMLYLACSWDVDGNHIDYGRDTSREGAIKIITDRIKGD